MSHATDVTAELGAVQTEAVTSPVVAKSVTCRCDGDDGPLGDTEKHFVSPRSAKA